MKKLAYFAIGIGDPGSSKPFQIRMAKGTEILGVRDLGKGHGGHCLLALVDPAAKEVEARLFALHRIDDELPDDGRRYIATLDGLADLPFDPTQVHLFELPPKETP